ncbi:hypothetical protein N9452_03380 [Alphaproteobacteria bacterium]|nr:hypothetical protein [Alphaproteobacteria bacterium]
MYPYKKYGKHLEFALALFGNAIITTRVQKKLFKNANKVGFRKKKDPLNSIQETLNEFSFAEFSSAVEMLQAAKRRDSKDAKMAFGFVKHALDEYKHTAIFRSIIEVLKKQQNLTKCETRFIPSLTIKKGYINPKSFLFDKFSLNRFSVFIGVNEGAAHKLFSDLRNKLGCYNNNELIVTKKDNIHLEKVLKKIQQDFDIILGDEARHAEFALGYARKNITPQRLRGMIFVEKVSSKIRTLYALQAPLNRGIAATIYIFVISLTWPLKFLVGVPERERQNLLDPIKSKLML